MYEGERVYCPFFLLNFGSNRNYPSLNLQWAVMEMELLEKHDIQDILREFGLRVDDIIKIGKVYKISSDGAYYGLKGIDISKGEVFFQNLQYLYQRGYYRFVPVYPAKNGQIMVLRGQKLFYLMPWYPNEKHYENDLFKNMFRELARLHGVTTKEIPNTEDRVQSHYGKVRLIWIREMDMLDQFMELCERKYYMSPFEGEFVQYYHELMKAYEYALEQLKKWKDHVSQKEKIRISLCHGAFSPDHFVFDERGHGHFINLEKCQWSVPFKEVLPFMIRSLKTYPKQDGEWVNWMNHYMKFFPLRPEEKYLMKSYLAHPGHFIPTLRKYQERKTVNHELVLTKELERNYWLFKNIEFIVMKLEEFEHPEEGEKRDGHT